jgi:hypothetical protein
VAEPRPFDRFDHQPGDKPSFCHACGRQLELVVVDHGTYDATTGERQVHWHPRCPRQPRSSFVFMFLRHGNHDEFCGPGRVVFA